MTTFYQFSNGTPNFNDYNNKDEAIAYQVRKHFIWY